MKKFLKLSMLLFALSLLVLGDKTTALAAEEGTIYAVDAEKDNLSNPDEASDHALYDYYGYISLKPADGIGKIIFTVNADRAGIYDISVVYTAKEGSASRKLDIYANDAAATNVTLECAADWDTFMTYTTSRTLVAGENKIVIATPAGYDNETVKTPNIYALQFKCTEPEATPTPEPTATTAPTVAPTTAPSDSAPINADSAESNNTVTIVIIVVVVVLLAGIVVFVSKKKKK